jgi:biopolymer transport protein ExbD
MSDVAFLLLIFFISTTIFRIEQGMPLLLPRAGATAMRVPPENVAVVQAFAGGLVTLDGEQVTLERLHDGLRRRALDNPGLIVSVETDERARYQVLVDVLDELQRARATRISLRTLPRPAP